MALSKTEREILKGVIARLSRENTSIAPNLIPHREALRVWLDTWIIGPLESVADEKRTARDLKTAHSMGTYNTGVTNEDHH